MNHISLFICVSALLAVSQAACTPNTTALQQFPIDDINQSFLGFNFLNMNNQADIAVIGTTTVTEDSFQGSITISGQKSCVITAETSSFVNDGPGGFAWRGQDKWDGEFYVVGSFLRADKTGSCTINFGNQISEISFRANAVEGEEPSASFIYQDKEIYCLPITNKPGNNTFNYYTYKVTGSEHPQFLKITGGTWALDQLLIVINTGQVPSATPAAAPGTKTSTASSLSVISGLFIASLFIM